MTDISSDPLTAGDAPGDTRWMSYTELAVALGIKRASAKRVAMRHRWQRQQGNDATARVAVPVTVLSDNRKGVRDDSRNPVPGGIKERSPGGRSLSVTGLNAAVEVLREQVAAANARADAADADRRIAQARLELAEVARDAARERAESAERERAVAVAIADEAVRAAEVATVQARSEVAEARDAADQIKQADEARQARGRWARLRAAWRGG
jgi:hypothetical protein